MCNPPFYSSTQEIEEARAGKTDMSSSVRSKLLRFFLGFSYLLHLIIIRKVLEATELEAITEGGEVQFVTTMITESRKLSDRFRYFVSFLFVHCESVISKDN
jgi:23S rRNA A1618 N6-methylase RlmF